MLKKVTIELQIEYDEAAVTNPSTWNFNAALDTDGITHQVIDTKLISEETIDQFSEQYN